MKSFAERLLAWYDREKRELPWREARDPWAIWVSEVMLQQTQVQVVRQLYPRFMKRFPTPAELARATDDQLLAAWKGLGYYRRARLLREAARLVVDQHGGRVPESVAELGDLPGVGEYTRGALASIAFGKPELAVDGNVERVTARHRRIETNVKLKPAAKAIRSTVARWMDRTRPGDFNQALMELGALICTPRNTRCPTCPVAEDCEALEHGLVGELPRLPERMQAVDVEARAVLVPVRGGRILASRIPEDEINGGQIDLPGPGILVDVGSAEDLAAALRRRFGIPFNVGPVVTTVDHGITHHRIRLHVHQAECSHGPGPNLMAVKPDDARLPWTTVARKVFRQAALFLTAGDRGR